ncbi:unnamed protein product [Ilex paraguariensis]|uniref:Protein kinase domain-containing protein n=2 Tax=Ilex paraguariensis TaxID=185542 RepID=A0ABC8TG83_9AQUA
MDEASTSREGEPQPSDLAADGSLSPSPSSSSQSVPWRPNELIFCPYSSILDSDARPRTLHDVVRRPEYASRRHVKSTMIMEDNKQELAGVAVGSSVVELCSLHSRWCPVLPYTEPDRLCVLEFCIGASEGGKNLNYKLVTRLTKDISETYKICNPGFHYSEELNPKRFLTSPSIGVLNDGYDNANSDLILAVNYVLVNLDTQRRYSVKDILGHGTFGQVAKCWVAETNSFVAVKIIKNQPAYYQQALVEVSILTTLNKKFDPEDKHHIVRIYDYFVYQRHLCIAFELLDTNLYELIKLNHFRGLSLSIVQLFAKQILHGLALMKDAGIIHCDLKPENILLCTSVKPAEIKIIDFGSACMEDRTVYSYIQSRYYRSPEVLLGYHYTTAIDMWSFGCIVAELFLGLPLFPGASEFDLLRRMIKILRNYWLASVASHTSIETASPTCHT